MKSRSLLTVLSLHLLILSGVLQGSESISPEARSLVDGNTRFALDLYRDLASTDSEANLFISPWSLSTALGMAWAGAVGETADEMAQALNFPFGQSTTHPLFGELIGNLNALQEDGKLILHTANALWPAAGHDVLPEYHTLLQSHYGAHAESLDFRNETEGSREHINEWVSGKTAERIPELIPQGMLSADTAIVLTNAIYFKGAWKTLFDPEKTVEAVFSAADGSSIEIPMMFLKEDLPFYEDSTVTLVTLPYHDERLEAVLLSPRSGSINTLESNLTPERLQNWLDARSTTEVTVRIPRFGLSDKRELSEPLKALGMERAFVPSEADFSGIFGQPDIFISWVIHETFLQVREEGTEAAGATGIGFEFTSIGPYFAGDRPFLFLIRDTTSASLLFLGRVALPEPLEEIVPTDPDPEKVRAFFGEGAFRNENGWWENSIIGPFRADRWPWLEHESLGWLYLDEATAGSGFWLHAASLGWLYSSPLHFPAFWSPSEEWLLYQEGTHDPSWFYHYREGIWHRH